LLSANGIGKIITSRYVRSHKISRRLPQPSISSTTLTFLKSRAGVARKKHIITKTCLKFNDKEQMSIDTTAPEERRRSRGGGASAVANCRQVIVPRTTWCSRIRRSYRTPNGEAEPPAAAAAIIKSQSCRCVRELFANVTAVHNFRQHEHEEVAEHLSRRHRKDLL